MRPAFVAGGVIALAACGFFSGLTWSIGYLDLRTIGAGAALAGTALIVLDLRMPSLAPARALLALVTVQAALHMASGIVSMFMTVSDGMFLPLHAVYHGLEILTVLFLARADLSSGPGCISAHGHPARILAIIAASIALGCALGMLSIPNTAFVEVVTLGLYVPAVLLLSQGTATTAAPSREEGEMLPHAPTTVELDALAKTFLLTPRERDVLDLWLTGHRVDYVANELGVSVNTVKTHVGHIYKKTGVTNREELLLLVKDLASPAR